MERQVDAQAMQKTGTFARFHWLVCDNGFTVEEGTLTITFADGSVDWHQQRPSAEYEGLVFERVQRVVSQT